MSGHTNTLPCADGHHGKQFKGHHHHLVYNAIWILQPKKEQPGFSKITIPNYCWFLWIQYSVFPGIHLHYYLKQNIAEKAIFVPIWVCFRCSQFWFGAETNCLKMVLKLGNREKNRQLAFQKGQSISMGIHSLARVWRIYSVTNSISN